MKDQMKAIVATGYGSPDVLKLTSIQKPTPKAGEVLIKIYASSATTADSMMRTGKPYFTRLFTGMLKPKHAVPGTGFAGMVVAIGNKVNTFSPGDEVFGETTLGFSTNAEYVSIPENGVIIKMPDNMTHAEAATLCDGHLTSMNFLRKITQVKAGQKVLVNGASGSLGSAAIQLAHYFGAEVTGVCSTKNVGLVKSLGADFVIDYTKEDVTHNTKTYDIIFDTVGTLSFRKVKKSLKEGGEYVSPVMKLSLLIRMIITSLTGKKKAKFGATGLSSDEDLRQLLNDLLKIYKEGKLTTVIDRQFPLEKLADAHRYISTGHKKGNVVIINQI